MASLAYQHPAELSSHAWERPLALPRENEPPRLWLGRSSRLATRAAQLADAVLDSGERKRAAAFAGSGDRDTFLVAHVGLRMLLGAYLGIKPSDVPLRRQPCPCCGGPHGRPEVRGSSLHFSLSHSGGLCLLGFAPAPVGVDIEAVPAPAVVQEVATSLHPREAAELDVLGPAVRPVAFARVWARKEAYLKGLGTGLARAPSRDYVGTAAAGSAALPHWTVGDVAVGDDHAAAFAVRG